MMESTDMRYCPFEQAQLDQLRAQIGAYKILKSCAPIPDNLLRASEGFVNILSEQEDQISKHILSIRVANQENNQNQRGIHTRIFLNEPSLALDPVVILKERDARLQARISQRLFEIANMPNSLTPQQKNRLHGEFLSLRLLNLQRQLRRDVLNAVKQDTSLDLALNVKAYRRLKRIPLRESKLQEGMERRHRMEVDRKRRQRQLLFLNEVNSHCKEFLKFHQTRAVKMQRFNKALENYVNTHERDKRREHERLMRERIKRLMAEDEDGYRQMIDKEKNSRLHYLLQQTDEFISGLTKLVREHKVRLRDEQRVEREKRILEARKRCNILNSELVETSPGKCPASLTPSKRIPLRHRLTGHVLNKDAAPRADQLIQWLDNNPGYEIALHDEECELLSDNDLEEDSSKHEDANEEEEVVVAIEDDEYQNPQQSYYAHAHSVTERLTRQPMIMVHGSLKEYQLRGVEWMVSLYNNNLNGILADEMGLGKTIQTIGLITYLIETKRVKGPFIIIVPLSTLSNWTMEFNLWAPSVRKVVYRGTPSVRRDLQTQIRQGLFNVLMTTYEYAIKDKAVLGKLSWKLLVIDEGHRMKNHHCKLTQVLSKHYNVPHRILLTGTPLQNKLPELWALLNFLLPHIFQSCVTFDQWFNAPFSQQIGTNEKIELNQEETVLIIRRLHKVLRPFLLRRLKKEVENQLPDKVEYVIRCEMSGLQRALYRHMFNKGVILTDGSEQKGDKKGKGGTRTLMNTLMQLRKICNHPFIFPHIEAAIAQHLNPNDCGSQTHCEGSELYRAAGKFELLDRMLPKLHAAKHRILIFCQMTQLMTIMQDYFDYRGFKYLRLDGTTKSDDRGDLLAKFNDPNSDIFIFILSTRAGGLGLNLQTADTVILFDSDWNPHQDLQAQDRAHRIGQENEVRVFRLITINSIEEKILAAARFKLNVDEKVIQAGMFDQKSTGIERHELLRSILEQDMAEEEEENATPDDETINQMLARNDGEFEFYQRLDEERERDNDCRRPRLITEAELPSWIVRDDAEVELSLNEQAQFSSQGAKRQRKEIDYSEGLTDREWIRSVQDSEEIPTNSKAPAYSNHIEKKRKRDSVGLSSSAKQMLQRQLSLMDILLKYRDPTGRILSEPFRKLPTRKELPDYYNVIQRPLDLNKVRKRIDSQYYRSMEMLDAEISELFNNARIYNREGSMIYENSLTLERVWNQARFGMDKQEGKLKPLDQLVDIYDSASKRQRRKSRKLLDLEQSSDMMRDDYEDSECSFSTRGSRTPKSHYSKQKQNYFSNKPSTPNSNIVRNSEKSKSQLSNSNLSTTVDDILRCRNGSDEEEIFDEEDEIEDEEDEEEIDRTNMKSRSESLDTEKNFDNSIFGTIDSVLGKAPAND